MNRKMHLIIKHGPRNVVGECPDFVSDEAVKINNPLSLEAEDEIAIKVR